MNLVLFLSGGCWVRLEANGASRGPLGRTNIIGGPSGVVGTSVWSSGAANAAPGGPRRRLPDLKARMDARKAPKSWIFMNFRKS